MYIIDRKLIRGGNSIVARPLDERNVVLKFSIMNGVYILVLFTLLGRRGHTSRGRQWTSYRLHIFRWTGP